MPFRTPTFCNNCKTSFDLKPGEYRGRDTFCGHTQYPTSIEAALNLIKHKGEFPCTHSPIRSEFLKLFKPHKKIFKGQIIRNHKEDLNG